MKNVAPRCAACGPLAAVAGYAVEHRLMNGASIPEDVLRQDLVKESGTLQDADVLSDERNWTWSNDQHRRRLSYSKSETTLHARHSGASSSFGWSQGYQGQVGIIGAA